jgi:hypothetical protein
LRNRCEIWRKRAGLARPIFERPQWRWFARRTPSWNVVGPTSDGANRL